MTRVIDAHQHYWRVAEQHTPVHPAVARDYEPDDLRSALREAGVDATVLVQSENDPAENRRLGAYAAATGSVAGVVGWLPLREPVAARRELAALAGIPRLAGVRCLIGRDPLEWLAPALFRELAEHGLVWDVVAVTAEQVEAVCGLADAVPRLRIVVDHLAAPPLAGGDWTAWGRGIGALSRRENVALKLSVGLVVLDAWDRWQAEALVPAVEQALEHFGPERVMLASNWPVILLRRSYAGAWRDLCAAVAEEDRAAVLGGTAARWYDLGPVTG
jgi:L-fuconolactonase